MKKPIILDKRAVRLEKITHPDYIPFLGGRPRRTTVIKHDDQLNLTILLNTIKSVEEFINRI